MLNSPSGEDLRRKSADVLSVDDHLSYPKASATKSKITKTKIPSKHSYEIYSSPSPSKVLSVGKVTGLKSAQLGKDIKIQV